MNYEVLIVEDSPILRRVVRRAVEQAGVASENIREAGHGGEALEHLDTRPADLILLDLNMPVMDGATFVRKKQADASIKDIKVVVVTTEGNQARMDELRELGVDGFLRKPFEPEDLRSIVKELLEGSDG